MKIAIVGAGYVGLVSGTCFAEMGNDVTCVDINAGRVARLRAGELPIYEPGLRVFFDRNLREKRLSFTTDLAEAVRKSAIIFLALPTPPGEDGSADLSYVLGVAHEMASLIDSYKVVVNKSTVPVGTADQVRVALETNGLIAGKHFDVVSNPEFLREGVAVEDFMKPERVVIGSSSERATELMQRLYKPFVRNGNPILVMDEYSAEMTKYAANAFLATKITFMNEVANLCERVGANVDHVRRGVGTDTRIGNKFLYPGIGFGGSCFPKDVQALYRTARQNAYDFKILDAVLSVNDDQRRILMPRILNYFNGTLAGRHVAVWGLAFKPNTDDVREAPSHVVIDELLNAGGAVTAFDPEAMNTTRAVLGDRIRYAPDDYACLQGADALVICTEWHEFRRPDFERMKQYLKQPVIFDGRNLYDPQEMALQGFDYYSIGRPHYAPLPVTYTPVSAAEVSKN